MRRVLLIVLLLTCATPPPPPPPPKIDYYEELRRHGEWILVSPYGKLWHPNLREVGKDFVPYLTGGQWERTPRGWSFEARWPWSEHVFHHGRWLWTQDFDWLWSLDEREGLAYVDWRAGSEWIGWAPQPPQAPRAGAPLPEQKWVYVKAKHFAQDEVAKYVVGHEEALKAANLTEPVPVGPFSGPGVDYVAAQGGLVQEVDGGYRVPELAAPVQEQVVEQVAPKSKVEVEVVKPPPPTKKGKKRRK
jgi:hypothetical protein